MRLDRAIPKHDQRVDDAFAVQDYVYAVEGHVEQPAGLDALQPLVEEGGAIYGDLLAHLPVGVSQRLLRGYPVQLFGRRVAEGAAGGGEDDALNAIGVLAPEALPDGGVFAVDGPQLGAVALRLGGKELAGHDEHLFVGQGHGLAGAQGGEGGAKAGDAQRGRHDYVRVRVGGHLFHAGPTGGDAAANVFALAVAVYKAGPELAGLLLQEGGVSAGGEADDVEVFGEGADYVQGLATDRARGAEDDEANAAARHRIIHVR